MSYPSPKENKNNNNNNNPSGLKKFVELNIVA